MITRSYDNCYINQSPGNGDVCSLKPANAWPIKLWRPFKLQWSGLRCETHRGIYAYEHDHVLSHPSCNNGVYLGSSERIRDISRGIFGHTCLESRVIFISFFSPREISGDPPRFVLKNFSGDWTRTSRRWYPRGIANRCPSTLCDSRIVARSASRARITITFR